MSTGNAHKSAVRFLYKSILRLHRGLPEELQALGTAYVKDEFRRHKSCDAPTAVVFMTEWSHYAKTLASQVGVKGIRKALAIGRPLDEETLEKMREDQIAQLYELMKASTNKE